MIYLLIGAAAGPCFGYILWISFLPEYRSWVHSALHLGVSRTSFVVGFSVFWVFAIIGIVRVVKEKRMDMLFLCIWAVFTILLLIGVGSFFYKFTGGAVIAYGILGALGLDHLVRSLQCISQTGVWGCRQYCVVSEGLRPPYSWNIPLHVLENTVLGSSTH